MSGRVESHRKEPNRPADGPSTLVPAALHSRPNLTGNRSGTESHRQIAFFNELLDSWATSDLADRSERSTMRSTKPEIAPSLHFASIS
jgi:hypothetical protein